jgi:hypothetical protein
LLAREDGEWQVVEAVEDTGGYETVYNVCVEEFHTYFVGEVAWGWSAWSHNSSNYVTPNGPGKRVPAYESMSPRAAAYQKRAAGLSPQWAYEINEVKFDGYKYGKLLDAKGPGYSWRFTPAPGGEGFKYPDIAAGKAEDFLLQARSQLKVAGKTPIEWRFAEADVADIVKALFQDHGIKINVVHFK